MSALWWILLAAALVLLLIWRSRRRKAQEVSDDCYEADEIAGLAIEASHRLDYYAQITGIKLLAQYTAPNEAKIGATEKGELLYGRNWAESIRELPAKQVQSLEVLNDSLRYDEAARKVLAKRGLALKSRLYLCLRSGKPVVAIHLTDSYGDVTEIVFLSVQKPTLPDSGKTAFDGVMRVLTAAGLDENTLVVERFSRKA